MHFLHPGQLAQIPLICVHSANPDDIVIGRITGANCHQLEAAFDYDPVKDSTTSSTRSAGGVRPSVPGKIWIKTEKSN